MNHLSLFTGYEGFGLGLKLAGIDIRTVGYIEIEPYCQEIIKARIKDKVLDDAPIYPDISAFNGNDYRGLVDIITGGFPCQPHSVTGHRQGEADSRNLWPDTRRLISQIQPEWVMLENVTGILQPVGNRDRPAYGCTVLGDLAAMGYNCRTGVVSAADAGAPHLRKRWWVMAHANRVGH